MTNLLYGALGAILVLAVFAAGVAVGLTMSLRVQAVVTPKIEAETSAEREIRRMKADQAAFNQMMNYNVDVAYGRVSAQDVSDLKEGDN
jgi:hypothetical protein